MSQTTSANPAIWPAEVDVILSSLEAASASHDNRRKLSRMKFRAIATLQLFSDESNSQPWTLYTRDVNSRGIGFICNRRVPLGHGGVVEVPGPNGEMITANCTVTAAFAINTASLTYTYTGFFAPVDNPSILNVAKAGQAIPVKWQIYYTSGAVADPTSFVSLTSAEIGCGVLVAGAVDTVETYSGSSGLQYLGSGSWQFNWKTPASYANSCRSMKVTLKDGSTHIAYFNFKK